MQYRLDLSENRRTQKSPSPAHRRGAFEVGNEGYGSAARLAAVGGQRQELRTGLGIVA